MYMTCPGSMSSRAIFSCTSDLFSTSCFRVNILFTVSLPLLKPCGSSTISHNIILPQKLFEMFPFFLHNSYCCTKFSYSNVNLSLYVPVLQPDCLLVYHGIQWYPMVLHGKPWQTMTLHDKLWYTMVYHVIPWYTMVYHGIPWYSMVFHGIPWYYMINHDITW